MSIVLRQAPSKNKVKSVFLLESNLPQMIHFSNPFKVIHLSPRWHYVYVCITGVFAVCLRLWLILAGWPPLNSDEGTMGLAALHIAFHGAHPIFFYGQNYMGTLEAYIGAFLFYIFGPSTLSLRLGLIALFICFFIAMYFLARLLYTPKIALLSLIFISLGTQEILFRQLAAAGGYMDTLAFGSIMMLLASWLSLKRDTFKKDKLCRFIGYGCWGLTVGLGLWSDLLVLPFVVTSGLLLIIACWRDIRGKVIACLLLGLVLGAFPLILFNITASSSNNSITTLWHILYVDGSGHVVKPPLTQEITGTLLVGLPVATNATALCAIVPEQAWPLSSQSTMSVKQCTALRGVWGIGFIIIWLIATASTLHFLWKKREKFSKQHLNKQPTNDERLVITRSFARLMLLASAGITLILFAVSPAAALAPFPCTRYLIALLVATPAMIAPLTDNTNSLFYRKKGVMKAKTIVCYGLIMFYTIALISGTITAIESAQNTYQYNQSQKALIDDLLDRNITTIYSDYWTCDSIMFQSGEQIMCSVLNEQLQAGINRYLPDSQIVVQHPFSSYIFPVNSSYVNTFRQKIIHSHLRYHELVLDNYVIYQPGPTH